MNFGVVDIYDRPYAELVNAIKGTAPRVNEFHENSARNEGGDVSRHQEVDQ